MIRHAGLLALAVVSLVVTVIQPSFGAALVAAVGLTALYYARLEAALGTAIALSAITVFADPEHGMAVRTTANPLTENSFTMNVHAHPKGGAGQLQPIRGRLGLASIA